MASYFTIYVEGSGDVKFIKDYFEFIFHRKVESNKTGGIINAGGKDKLFAKDNLVNFENQLIQTTEKGGINLVIFDADTSKNNGGFRIRFLEITAKLKQVEAKIAKSLNYAIFLLPDHKSDGALEDLLERIINPINVEIFDCWAGYEKCLVDKNKSYTLPAKKSKIYSYLEVLYGDTYKEKELVKDPNRDYNVAKHWDLANPALTPLKNFLILHCT